jgi:hypothetical protein
MPPPSRESKQMSGLLSSQPQDCHFDSCAVLIRCSSEEGRLVLATRPMSFQGAGKTMPIHPYQRTPPRLTGPTAGRDLRVQSIILLIAAGVVVETLLPSPCRSAIRCAGFILPGGSILPPICSLCAARPYPRYSALVLLVPFSHVEDWKARVERNRFEARNGRSSQQKSLISRLAPLESPWKPRHLLPLDTLPD